MALLDPIRAVILDLDGTLVDTLGDFELALRAMLGDLGRPAEAVTRRFISLTVGKGSEHLVGKTLDLVGLASGGEGLLNEALERYQHHYAHFNGQGSHLFPGVVEGLARLTARNLPLVCLTNKPGRHARHLLELKGLAGAFAHVFGGDAFSRKKPDPLPLIETCRALGRAPAEVLMVGDSINDSQAGHAAGCVVALVSYGYNHGRPIREVPAAAYVDRLDQLTER